MRYWLVKVVERLGNSDCTTAALLTFCSTLSTAQLDHLHGPNISTVHYQRSFTDSGTRHNVTTQKAYKAACSARFFTRPQWRHDNNTNNTLFETQNRCTASSSRADHKHRVLQLELHYHWTRTWRHHMEGRMKQRTAPRSFTLPQWWHDDNTANTLFDTQVSALLSVPTILAPSSTLLLLASNPVVSMCTRK